jgi:hypothetical protein
MLKIGLAAALLGVTAGVIIAVVRLKHGGDFLELPGFAPPMVVPVGLGALAAVLAIAEMVSRERYRQPAVVFLLGLTSIATPFLLALALGAVVLLAIAAAIVGSCS